MPTQVSTYFRADKANDEINGDEVYLVKKTVYVKEFTINSLSLAQEKFADKLRKKMKEYEVTIISKEQYEAELKQQREENQKCETELNRESRKLLAT
jgi:hypothetical protein